MPFLRRAVALVIRRPRRKRARHDDLGSAFAARATKRQAIRQVEEAKLRATCIGDGAFAGGVRLSERAGT